MTTLLTLLLTALLTLTTAREPVHSVELTLQTRGVHKSIRVTPQQTLIDVNGRQQQQVTTPARWKSILTALKNVELAQMASLPADVSRSSVDAALMAHVSVTTASQTYESVTYDHPSTPTVLAPLVKAIIGSTPAATQTEFRR